MASIALQRGSVAAAALVEVRPDVPAAAATPSPPACLCFLMLVSMCAFSIISPASSLELCDSIAAGDVAANSRIVGAIVVVGIVTATAVAVDVDVVFVVVVASPRCLALG